MKKLILLFLIMFINESFPQEIYWEPIGNVGGTVFTFGLDSSNNIFAGTYNAIYKSTDDGKTWIKKLSGGQYTNFLAFAVNRDGHIITTTHSSNMFRSTDKGETWKSFAPMPYQDYRPLVYLPNGDLITAPHNRGLYRSKDDGNKWEKVEGGLDANIIWSVAIAPDGKVFAGTNNFLFLSLDTGYTWKQIMYDSTCSGARTVFISSDGSIYIGSEITVFESKVYLCGAFRSTDGGTTWHKAFYGLDTSLYRAIISIIEPLTGVFYIGTNEWGVYRSIDNGQNCQRVSNGLEEIGFLWYLFLTKSGNILAGTNKGMFRTNTIVTNYEEEFNNNKSENLIQINNGKVKLNLIHSTEISVLIYDLLGRNIKKLNLGYLSSGEHVFENLISDLHNGLYIIEIKTNNFSKVIKTIIYN